jgi:membrane protein
MAALYHYVPNTQVNWRHAWAGGLFVAVCIELAKKVLALYLGKVPTYSAVYGTFATLPILLVWIYVAWVIVLLGAVVAAYLPSLLAGVARRGTATGLDFQLAVEVLQQLDVRPPHPGAGPAGRAARAAAARGCAAAGEPVLDALTGAGLGGAPAARRTGATPRPGRAALCAAGRPEPPRWRRWCSACCWSARPAWRGCGAGRGSDGLLLRRCVALAAFLLESEKRP